MAQGRVQKEKNNEIFHSGGGRGGGVSDGSFSTRQKTWASTTGFCMMMNFRQTYFFNFFWGGDPFQLGSWSEGSLKLYKPPKEVT